MNRRYLEWLDSQVPSDEDVDTDVYARTTKVEHPLRVPDLYSSIARVHPVVPKVEGLEGLGGCQKYSAKLICFPVKCVNHVLESREATRTLSGRAAAQSASNDAYDLLNSSRTIDFALVIHSSSHPALRKYWSL